MLCTEDFTMRHYVGFSQIGSHIGIFYKDYRVKAGEIIMICLRTVKCLFP